MKISLESTCVGVFNKVVGPQKKETPTQVFSCEFCELFRNTYFVEDLWTAGSETPVRLFENIFFTEHLQWLILTVSGFQPATLLKKRLRQRCFSVNFAKFLRISVDRTPPDDCFLCYLRILRSYSDHLFSRAPLGNCLLHVQVAGFQPPDKVKKYFTSAFQAFYTRTRSSNSKAFIYWKSLKMICEEVNL